jgi:Cellulase (glycosyl hydrolase family 5)
MVTRPDRRSVLLAGGASLLMGGQRSPARRKIDLWDNATGPHLRGAVLPQRRVYPAIDGDTFLGPGPVGTPITDAALASLAANGGNLAVLSHPGIFTETAPYRIDHQIADHLARLVERCASHGLFAVIGFRTGPGRSEFTFHRDDGDSWFPASMIDERLWQDDDAQNAWADMWKQTARQFRGNPAVAGYLVMVEPNGSHVVRRSPWPRMARILASAVREVDTETPLLISPDGYANRAYEGELDLTGLGQTVLAIHDYSPFAYTHSGPESAASFSTGSAQVSPPEAGRWMVGEWGVRRWAFSAPAFARLRLQSMEEQGANSAWFSWPSGWGNYEQVENGWNPFFGPDAETTRRISNAPLVGELRRFWTRNAIRP